ncbi:MAG: putative rane protein [Bryobacterales bacterium]|jgi:uncharacterized membrane protein|nr:putative rane protein [Bryobacterales bacterium]
MTNRPDRWSDHHIESVMGDLLRAGVLLSAAIVMLGGVIYLIHQGNTAPDYGVFRGEPPNLQTVTGIVADALRLSGRGIIQLGLLVLIATPVARVVFAVFAFSAQRDWLYVLVSAIVLGVLTFSLRGGIG